MMIACASQQDMALEVKSRKEKCGICCIPVTARGVLDCCSDTFCFSCIDTWSAFTNLCPLCKLKFKFITFVPVADEEDASDVEAQEAFYDFLGQERVDHWIDNNEDDGTLSFPSYFIEEDAVVCLDGDGCRVRQGLNDENGESGLEDTSVACDSCDCWYHASCVGYKPDSQGQRSWICPRCVGTGVLDLFKFQLPSKNLTSKLPSKSMSLDKDGSFTFVDEGETAVVVSMDFSFRPLLDQTVDQATDFDRITGFGIGSSLDESCPKNAADTQKISEGSSTGVTDFLLQDASMLIQNVSSPQRESAAVEKVDGQNGVAVDYLSKPANLMQEASDTSSLGPVAGAECSALDGSLFTSPELAIDIGKPSYFPSVKDEAIISSSTVSEAKSSSQVSQEGVPNQDVADIGQVSEGKGTECKREICTAQEPKNQQEIGDAKQHDKFLKRREPPHSLLEKQQREKKKLKSEDRGSLSSNSSEIQSWALPDSSCDNIPNEAARNREPAQPLIKKELIEHAVHESDFCDALPMQDVSKPKSEVFNELKELVQGPAPCHRRVVPPRMNTSSATHGAKEGVRTRKIIYRGSVLDDNVSQIVNEMRKHLKREAATFGATEDGTKIDVTDEKFFVAFKAAIQSTQANLRPQHLSPNKKVAFQKRGSKRDGSRQSLMKKLYGGSGKRRRAWDRDWDVSFWRERIIREKNSKQSCKTLLQQEMAHIEEALQDSKKANKAELDSLKSRVYIADTSLLPRQKDIKPLSELSAVKSSSPKVPESKPLVHKKTGEEAPKRPTASEVCNVAASDGDQSLKTDKRKWALEVLARKTGQSKKLQKDKGPLLADLPRHMRPVLEYDRRSKVPTATRQIQLDRFIEHYLQQALIESLNDNSECQAAITAALNKEKEIYDRSNSKVVYVNLCVQALASSPKVAASRAEETLPVIAAEIPSSSAVELASVKTAGSSQNEDFAVLMALKAAGLISDSPPGSPVCVGVATNTPETGISSHNPDDHDCCSRSLIEPGNTSSAGDSYPAFDHKIDEAGINTFCTSGMENIKDEETCIQATSTSNSNIDMENVQDVGESDVQRVMVKEELQDKAEAVEHHAPLQDAPGQEGNLQERTSAQEGNLQETRHACFQAEPGQEGYLQETQHHCSIVSMPSQEQQSATIQEFATDSRGEAAPDANERVEKISKQVESYVKEHIRPLHRSQIITTEQYKWTVAKTTNKVMQHHSQAKSADFLIAEGEKVRRLAEQYLQLYSEHIFPGTR